MSSTSDMDALPTVGRTVHYLSYGTPNGEFKSQVRAAIITAVPTDLRGAPGVRAGDNPGDVVSLCVLNPDGLFFNKEVAYSAEYTAGHWSWPPRV